MRTIKLKCGNKPYRCKRGKRFLRVQKKLCIATVLNPAINNEAKSFVSRKERCKEVLQTQHQRNNSERLNESQAPKSSQNRLARPTTSHNRIQQWQCELIARRGQYLGNYQIVSQSCSVQLNTLFSAIMLTQNHVNMLMFLHQEHRHHS